MKRLLIAASIAASAACLFGAVQNQSLVFQKLNATRSEQSRVQAARLDQLWTERNELLRQVDETRRNTKSLQRNISVDELAEEYATNGLTNMSPEQAEQLRTELGFSWDSFRDYVVVSKKSLASISLTAVSNGKLTDGVRSALAITPGEQAAIETELQRITDEYNAWVLTHVQREEPGGDILARYVLPRDPQSSNRLQSLSRVVRDTLSSNDRDKLFFQYSLKWGAALQLAEPAPFGGADQTVMVVRRVGGSLMVDLREPACLMPSSFTPSQPFPEAFLPLFPGGWKDLAEREGIALPQEIQKN